MTIHSNPFTNSSPVYLIESTNLTSTHYIDNLNQFNTNPYEAKQFSTIDLATKYINDNKLINCIPTEHLFA